ncbi:fibronectin type III domain-containing protein [Paenibacillus eucommiae]|uniref:Fibronectin type-III domain-containing protein n=1 Tax=Paenibacillus eucommiae TaxID=1355755 RepID=A0ABS4ITR6_9BACL|nr:fibronectin type III domain-containing protein [Paenibacillus eucommiae]MBP1990505.1 hypothetical protein [Paenibacillus eucommiae]
MGKKWLLGLFAMLLLTGFIPANHTEASWFPSIQADGRKDEWNDISPLIRGKHTTVSTLKVTNDAAYLYVLVEGIGLSALTSHFYLNTDGSDATGYQEPGWDEDSGADYLLETSIQLEPVTVGGQVRNVKKDKATLLSYTGTGTDWSWSQAAEYKGSGQIVKTDSLIEARIPLSDLGLSSGSDIHVGFVNYYSKSERLPAKADDLAVYTLKLANSERPSVPAGLNVTNARSTKLQINWSPSTDNIGVKGYKIYRVKADNIEYAGWTTTTSYTDGWLQPSTAYSYKVEAFDTDGYSSGPSLAVTGSTTAYPSVPASTGDWSEVTDLLFNYTVEDSIDAEEFASYDLLALSGAVSPEKLNEIKAINPDIFIVGYISVGQDAREGNSPDIFFKDSEGNPECDLNWPSCFIDPTNQNWQKKVLDELLPGLVERGFDGFYLDTVEVTEVIHTDKAWGMGQLVQKIKEKYPDKKVFSGGGVHLLRGGDYDIRSSVDAVLFESYTNTWVGDMMWDETAEVPVGNAETYGVYTPYDHPRKMDYLTKRDVINKARFQFNTDGTLVRDVSGKPLNQSDAQFHVFTLDYNTPFQPELIRYSAERAWADGFLPSFGMKLLYFPPAFDWRSMSAYTPFAPLTDYNANNFGKTYDLLKYIPIEVDGDGSEWSGTAAHSVTGTGSVAKMSVAIDGTNLNVLVEGTGLNVPGQRIILNTDQNMYSGYQFPEWFGNAYTGTDFIIENGTLLKHLGDPWSSSGWTSWLWEETEEPISYVVNGAGTVIEASIPLELLTSVGGNKLYPFSQITAAYMKFTGAATTETLPQVLPSTTDSLLHFDFRGELIKADGLSADWTGLGAVSSASGAGSIHQISAIGNGYHLNVLVEGTGLTSNKGRLLLNTDNNLVTGYQSSSWGAAPSTGADFMVEDGELFEYAGGGSDWSWKRVVRYPDIPVGPTGYAASASAIEYRIPLDAVHLSPISTFSAAFQTYSGGTIVESFPHFLQMTLPK